MNKSSFAFQETKVYRLSRIYRVYHFAVGVAALIGAIMAFHLWFFAAVLFLFAVFMIARPLIMSVTVDESSVRLRGMFSEHSLQRSSITAVEMRHTGKTPLLILWGNMDKKERLVIPALFGFDDEWNDWLGTYRDLSEDKLMSLF